MSIHEMLRRLEGDGKLVRFHEPTRFPEQRMLYISLDLVRQLRDPRSSVRFFGQAIPMQAMFEHWAGGGEIMVRLGGRSGDAELARLEPPPEEIWELRVTRCAPQVRIFCRFAARDTLVALTAWNRDQLGGVNRSRNRPGKSWPEAMYGCLSEWNRLFRGADAFRGRAIGDYVSTNCTGPE